MHALVWQHRAAWLCDSARGPPACLLNTSASSLIAGHSGACSCTCASAMQVAPAMNTAMWEHPLTARQLSVLTDLGVQVVPPISKKLACGDIGAGALASPEDIAKAVCACLDSSTVSSSASQTVRT